MSVDSQGVQIKRGDGASPEVFTAIGKVQDIQGPGGSASVRDVTNLDSTAREKKMGLIDEGQVTLELDLDTADAAQTGLRTDRSAGTLRSFQIVLTDSPATTISFSAYVSTFSLGIPVDDEIPASVTLEISGLVTWA